MGKRFTQYAFHHSYGLERAHGPCFRLLLLPDQYHTGITAKSRLTVQYPYLPSAMRSVPQIAELPVPKPLTSMTLSDSESSDEDVDQDNKIWIVIQHLQEPVLPVNHSC